MKCAIAAVRESCPGNRPTVDADRDETVGAVWSHGDSRHRVFVEPGCPIDSGPRPPDYSPKSGVGPMPEEVNSL